MRADLQRCWSAGHLLLAFGATCLSIASGATAAAIEINDGKLQSISSAGIAEATLTFPVETAASAKLLKLSSTASLKLSFSCPNYESVAYAALILSAPSPRSLSASLGVSTNESLSTAAHAEGGSGELFRRAQSQVNSVSMYLAPKKGGRYRWEWDPAANAAREDVRGLARRTSGNLQARVILAASARDVESSSYEVGMITLDEAVWKSPAKARKWPREWEMDRFSAREELFWTFRQPQRQIQGWKALAGLIVVASPWLFLLFTTSHVLPLLRLSMPITALPFLGVLTALEGLILAYWTGAITAWQLIPLTSGAGVIAVFAGKSALSARLRNRQRHDSSKVVKMG